MNFWQFTKTYYSDWRAWILIIIYMVIVVPLLIIHYRTGW